MAKGQIVNCKLKANEVYCYYLYQMVLQVLRDSFRALLLMLKVERAVKDFEPLCFYAVREFFEHLKQNHAGECED